MQTLTIRTDETIMRQLVAIGKILASSANASFETLTTELTDEYAKELNARADEALKGKGLIDEATARDTIERIKAGILSDVEAIKRGELETISHDELKARVMQW